MVRLINFPKVTQKGNQDLESLRDSQAHKASHWWNYESCLGRWTPDYMLSSLQPDSTPLYHSTPSIPVSVGIIEEDWA